VLQSISLGSVFLDQVVMAFAGGPSTEGPGSVSQILLTFHIDPHFQVTVLYFDTFVPLIFG
jgi:hypothetical protein